LPISGERTGEQLIERLRRAFGTSRARLFTVAAGAEADSALLSELARAGGGQALRVSEADQTTARALELAAAIKVPTITELELDLGAGLDEPFVSAGGKVSRGEEVVVLARTHHDFPEQVKVRGRLGAERFEKKYDVERDASVLGEFVPKLWAAEYVRRLLGASDGVEAERGRIVALGLEYGIVTPFTSILALESEDAYARMGIQRKGRSRLRGVKLSLLGPDDERRIAVRASAVPAAPLFFGCSRSEAPSSQSEPRVVGASPPAEMAKSEPAAPPPTATPATAAPEPVEEEAEKAAEPAPDLAKGALDGFDAPQARAAAGPGSGGLGLGSIGSIRGGAGGGGRVAAKPSAPAARERSARRDENAWSAAVPVLGTCSDVAGRPLAERMLLWRKRLRAASTAPELAARYDAARRACELSDWRVERVFLELLQVRIRDASSAEFILRHFEGRRDVQKFLAKLILRRAVDPALVSAVERALFGGQVDWADVDLKLQAIADLDARILKLREYMARAPEDPNGGMRLVRLLAQANRRDEALTLGRKLRDQGLMTPRLAQELGDVLTRAGLEAEAVRTYSEIVEFDPDGRDSRRLLGDIFLGHGWYEPAYRQYRTMTDAAPEDALARLRLAAAAAGSGRIDEALRLERHVATSEGTPGPSDPRRWARLLSAARLARLIDKPPALLAGEADSPERRKESMKRELKELQLFSGPGVLRVLTWEQLDADVALEAQSGAAPAAVGDATDAARAGLSALALSVPEAARVTSTARLRSLARARDLPLVLHEITWDGKDFGVRLERRSLPPGQAAVEL
jgi:tetratricopeptide (TPR) repeat protein